MKYTKEQITEAFENEKLFVKCLNEVKDDLDVYCLVNKEYEVIEEDNGWIIECELEDNELIAIGYDDKDFELIIKE